MVNELFDNRFALTYADAFSLFEKLIRELFEKYSVLKTENYGMSFKIEYQLDEYKFVFRSERGYIEEYLLLRNEEKCNLLNFQPLLKNIEVASKKNVRFLIETLKLFISEQSPQI